MGFRWGVSSAAIRADIAGLDRRTGDVIGVQTTLGESNSSTSRYESEKRELPTHGEENHLRFKLWHLNRPQTEDAKRNILSAYHGSPQSCNISLRGYDEVEVGYHTGRARGPVF